MSDTTKNMNVGSQVEVGPVKVVGPLTIEGSYPGDHRPGAAQSVLPNNPTPREAKGQSKVGGGE